MAPGCDFCGLRRGVAGNYFGAGGGGPIAKSRRPSTRPSRGHEEAIAHLNANPTNLTTDGWTLSQPNYVKQRTIGDGYYSVPMSTNPGLVVVNAQGFVRAPLQTGAYVPRSVRVTL